MRRRDLLAGLAAAPLLARAASEPRRKRLGVLAFGRREETLAYHDAMMRRHFVEYGWVEGRTLEIVWRFCDGDETRAPALAKELVAERPDVIATASTARTRAIQRATSSIPVITSVGDPVGSGFAKSLARPGGNITGLALGMSEIGAKQVDLLRLVLPKLSTLLVLGGSRSRPIEEIAEPFIAAARGARITTTAQRVTSLAQAEAAMRALPGGGRGAVFLLGHFPDFGRGDVTRLAIRLRVPSMAGDEDMVEKGALLALMMLHEDAERRTVALVDKLFRGADPATIPFELPGKSYVAINRRTAAAIGVNFPADFVLRADRVFD
jgi:putative ABC transport system substrate-binding protein